MARALYKRLFEKLLFPALGGTRRGARLLGLGGGSAPAAVAGAAALAGPQRLAARKQAWAQVTGSARAHSYFLSQQVQEQG